MLKSFLREYLGLTTNNLKPIPTAREVANELELSTWFRKITKKIVEEAMRNELGNYKREFSQKAQDSAELALQFLKKEEFIDSIVERIKKKQL